MLNKIKTVAARQFARVVRNSAIKSLTTNQNMSGKMRRSLLRSTGVVIRVGTPKKDPEAKIARKVEKASHVQRCRWFVRIAHKVTGIEAKMQKAGAAKMDRAVEILKQHRGNLLKVRGIIGAFFADQAFDISERMKAKP